MTLLQRQQLFSRLLPRLIDHAHELGFEVTLGEVYRPWETADLYARQGRGSARSLHVSRLAVDLHLFRGGVFLTRTSDHAELGAWWEAQHELARWGGHFSDGNHYSVAWEGRA